VWKNGLARRPRGADNQLTALSDRSLGPASKEDAGPAHARPTSWTAGDLFHTLSRNCRTNATSVVFCTGLQTRL
jgi:hypothetical protein